MCKIPPLDDPLAFPAEVHAAGLLERNFPRNQGVPCTIGRGALIKNHKIYKIIAALAKKKVGCR